MKTPTVKNILLSAVVLIVLSATCFGKSSYNIKGGLGLKGYDPVSYFEGESPKKGDKKIVGMDSLNGINYRFANEANKAKFEANPLKYSPQHGGWCSWAMLDGKQYKINPKHYLVINGKSYFFYNKSTKKKWMQRAAIEGDKTLISIADKNWAQMKIEGMHDMSKKHSESRDADMKPSDMEKEATKPKKKSWY